MRGNQRLTTNPELGEHKGNVGSCPQVLHVCFNRFPGFSLVSDPRGRLRGFGEKVRSACEEFEDSESNNGSMFLTVPIPPHPGCPGIKPLSSSCCISSR